MAVWALTHGVHHLTFRFVPEPRGAAAGDSRPTPPDWHPSALREASEIDASGSTAVGLALHGLARLAIRRFYHESLTVLGWHRNAFRVFWTWKIRRGKVGRPTVPKEVRQLIRTMSRENPIWGAPRIYGELLN
jgi:hypothetical protein